MGGRCRRLGIVAAWLGGRAWLPHRVLREQQREHAAVTAIGLLRDVLGEVPRPVQHVIALHMCMGGVICGAAASRGAGSRRQAGSLERPRRRTQPGTTHAIEHSTAHHGMAQHSISCPAAHSMPQQGSPTRRACPRTHRAGSAPASPGTCGPRPAAQWASLRSQFGTCMGVAGERRAS